MVLAALDRFFFPSCFTPLRAPSFPGKLVLLLL